MLRRIASRSPIGRESERLCVRKVALRSLLAELAFRLSLVMKGADAGRVCYLFRLAIERGGGQAVTPSSQVDGAAHRARNLSLAQTLAAQGLNREPSDQ